ncbi:hypothetical protein C2845_PM16G07980 [Panicum miliaceum]|uniref:Uncharacterized protein n=1 Tax=Panicum miliaceum TaxID=4540 RepID=A0A3L6PWB0_PANMI|nr:hypothetical protein C2845_PM16G07980 [Panicum miliaceum]
MTCRCKQEWRTSDDSGRLIADCAVDYRATSIARSVNRKMKCLDNLKLLLHKASLIPLAAAQTIDWWHQLRPSGDKECKQGFDSLHVGHLAHLERMAAFSTRKTNANAAAQSNQRGGRTLVPSRKRKRKEDLRTIGMGGIRNALSQISISDAREEIRALHSFMFPLLMLLGHLFLPLPCSQILGVVSCCRGTHHACLRQWRIEEHMEEA